MKLNVRSDHLVTVLMIAEQRSITRAAKRLYLDRSTVNRQLLFIESQLGTPLFKRAHGLMLPTEIGKAYLDIANKTLSCITEGEKKLSDLLDGIDEP